MGPEDRQFPEFFASQEHPEAYARKVLVNRHRSLLRRLRLEARHAGRDRAEAPDPGPHEELLVVREAIRRGGPPGAPGVRADPAQGLKVDQSTTRGYYRFGQPWLVISPGGRSVSAGDDRRITVYTAVTPPSQYPGKPVKGHDDLGGQSFSTLSGRRSSGRRPDGRASTRATRAAWSAT